MKVEIKFSTANAAFEFLPEMEMDAVFTRAQIALGTLVTRYLPELVTGESEYLPVKDSNGNKVGTVKITKEDTDEEVE